MSYSEVRADQIDIRTLVRPARAHPYVAYPPGLDDIMQGLHLFGKVSFVTNSELETVLSPRWACRSRNGGLVVSSFSQESSGAMKEAHIGGRLYNPTATASG